MRTLTFFSIFILVFSFFSLLSAKQVNIQLSSDEVAIIGYGSLMNRASIAMSLGRKYDGPLVSIIVHGWSRDFTAVMPNNDFFEVHNGKKTFPDGVAYANATESQNQSMLAKLFIIKKSELANFDLRESIYDRIKVNPALASVSIVGDVFMYVAKPQHRIENFVGRVIIRKSYLERVQKELAKLVHYFKFSHTQTNIELPYNANVSDARLDKHSDPFGYKGIQRLSFQCIRLFN